MSFEIADLHCDLLCYLEGQPTRTARDASVRCSIPQLKEGHVQWQTLAVFAETGSESVRHGMQQVAVYRDLPSQYPQDFAYAESAGSSASLIKLFIAFESASTFCDEQESLQTGLNRLRSISHAVGKPLYISLTWNMENRFGGGAATKIGLKADGKHLLEELHQQKIAVDLSHTSDALAYDILNYLDQKQLDVPILASHSNSRSVISVPRNLPDELASEIFRLEGLIGLNLYRPFIGIESPLQVAEHVEHWLKLGGENSICMGADFFFGEDLPLASRPADGVLFYPEYGNASCYPFLLSFLGTRLGLQPGQLEKLARRNFMNYMDRQHRGLNRFNLQGCKAISS